MAGEAERRHDEVRDRRAASARPRRLFSANQACRPLRWPRAPPSDHGSAQIAPAASTTPDCDHTETPTRIFDRALMAQRRARVADTAAEP